MRMMIVSAIVIPRGNRALKYLLLVKQTTYLISLLTHVGSHTIHPSGYILNTWYKHIQHEITMEMISCAMEIQRKSVASWIFQLPTSTMKR